MSAFRQHFFRQNSLNQDSPKFNDAKVSGFTVSPAHQQPSAIDATLKKECEAGRILGHFQTPPLENFHTSRLCVIPKHDRGWHIIPSLCP